jgi:hypothetical protein
MSALTALWWAPLQPPPNSGYSQYELSFVCATGYVHHGGGPFYYGDSCDPADPNQSYPLCPAGSYYNNNAQTCLDDVTQAPSVCPSDFPIYDFTNHFCYWKYGADSNLLLGGGSALNCQTIPLQLGACVAKKIPSTGNQCPAGKSYVCDPLTTVCSCQ